MSKQTMAVQAPAATAMNRMGPVPAPGPVAFPPSPQSAEIRHVGLVPPKEESTQVGVAAPQGSMDGSWKGGTSAGAAGRQGGKGVVGSSPGQPGSAGLEEGFNEGRRAASAA